MIDQTSKRIHQLLIDAGLLPSNNKKTEVFTNFNFSEETILITGAAGSIGSGLVKQLLHTSFKQLILIDNAETSLYYLIKELEIQQNKKVYGLILDVREKDSMECLFETYKPTLIFHAAAYKHLSLMEDNPYEAIKLNIFATKLLADLAIKHKTKTFVFISTDKAVNPISVMGMTKLIAEKYLNSLRSHNDTSFITIRFGNIFGSNGSVVPLFIKQIKSSKPITVTSKEATRYFIDNGRGCNLILKVATMPIFKENNITFNMGEPIKIIDLAHTLNEIYNYKTKIKITNLKIGEKLHETIIAENEILKVTSDEDIFIILKNEEKNNGIDLSRLYNITPYEKASEIKDALSRYI